MDTINGEYPPGVFFRGSQNFGQKNKGSQIFRRKFKGSQINFKSLTNFSKFPFFEETDPNIAKIVTIQKSEQPIK